MNVTVLTVRTGLSVAIYFTVASVAPGWGQAQAPGDIGSPECARQQQAMQATVGGETVGAYQALDARINAAAALIGSAAAVGAISGACANCILDQLFRGVGTADQSPCGVLPATPTVPAPRRQRSPVPTARQQ